MTELADLKTCLTSLKNAQAGLELLALYNQSEETKSALRNSAQSTQQVIKMLEGRVQQLEQEKPSNKAF